MRRTIVDTADRLRPGDHIQHDGMKMLIADITDASTLDRPGRLGVLIVDPHGRMLGHDGAKLLLVDPGFTLTFEMTPGRSRRPYAAMERIQVRRRGIGFEVFSTITGDWAYLTAGPNVGPFSGYAEADERALGLLCPADEPTVDPEVDRIVTHLRKSTYQSTAEHVLVTTGAVVDKAIDLGLIRVVQVRSTTHNRRGERMLAAA